MCHPKCIITPSLGSCNAIIIRVLLIVRVRTILQACTVRALLEYIWKHPRWSRGWRFAGVRVADPGIAFGESPGPRYTVFLYFLSEGGWNTLVLCTPKAARVLPPWVSYRSYLLYTFCALFLRIKRIHTRLYDTKPHAYLYMVRYATAFLIIIIF